MSTFWRVSAFRSKMLAYFDYYYTIILTSNRRRNWWNRGQNSCTSIFGTSWWYIKSYNNGTWMNLLDRASCLIGAQMKYASHLSKLHANSCYRTLLIFSQSPSSSLATDEISKPLIQVPCKFLLPAVSTIHYSFSKKPNSSLQAILQHRRTTLLSRGIVFKMITVTTALSRFHLHKWMRRLDILEIFLSELVFSDWSRTRPSERCTRRLHGDTTCHLRWR